MRRAPRIWSLSGALVAIGLIAVLAATTGQPAPQDRAERSGQEPRPVAASATARQKPGPDPARPAALPSSRPSAPALLGPTTIGRPASFHRHRMTAEVLDARAATGTGHGVGEVSGPAVLLELRLTNRSGSAVPVAGAVVNAYYGTDTVPAGPLLGDRRSAPFEGTVRAGGTVSGTYVFTVPEEGRRHLRIEISYAPTSPVVVFVGAA